MIRRFLEFNGISIFAVILFHAAGWGFVAMFAWSDRYLPGAVSAFSQIGSGNYYYLRFIEQLIVFSIPAFLLVSGFFIAFATPKKRSTVGWDVVTARLKYLVIPYLIWTFILFVGFFLQGKRFGIDEIVVSLLTGRTNPAYYYIPLLFQLYLLSPLLVYFAKKSWRSLLVITLLIQLAVQLSYLPFLLGSGNTLLLSLDVVPKWFFPTRIFWFTLGIVAGFQRKRFNQLASGHVRLWLALALLLIPLGMIEWEQLQQLSNQPLLLHRETLLDSVYAFAVIFGFLGLRSSIPFARYIGDIGVKSLGIYLIHSLVMEYTARAIAVLLPWLLAYQIILQPLLIVMGLGVPLVLMLIVNRSPLRRYYRYIFG